MPAVLTSISGRERGEKRMLIEVNLQKRLIRPSEPPTGHVYALPKIYDYM